MIRLGSIFAVAAAVSLCGCSVVNAVLPLPDSELPPCLSQGKYMDRNTRQCTAMPAPPAPTAVQVEASRNAQAEWELVQHCDPRIRARYDAAISQLSNEAAEYMRHSHQNERAQDFATQNDIQRMNMRLQDERLQACRSAAASTSR
jgi:hypothetical protein